MLWALAFEGNMALMKCHECGKEISTLATACPYCGAPPEPAGVPPGNQHLMPGVAVTPPPEPPKRKVGPLLGVGIFILPLVFAWFTLNSGHSTVSRIVSFGWLGIVVLLKLAALSLLS